MPLPDHAELIAENERLRDRLAAAEREAADSARQLELYAADLRETFKSERERTPQLTRPYMATVRALSNADGAAEAYTGRQPERVARYAIERGRDRGLPGADAPEIEFGFLLHDIGK